jgi:hypothetical protein
MEASPCVPATPLLDSVVVMDSVGESEREGGASERNDDGGRRIELSEMG